MGWTTTEQASGHNIWHITYGNTAVKFAYSTTNGIWHNVRHMAVTFVYGKLNPHGLYVCLYYSSSLVLQRIILVLHVTIQRRKQSDCKGCHDHHQKLWLTSIFSMNITWMVRLNVVSVSHHNLCHHHILSILFSIYYHNKKKVNSEISKDLRIIINKKPKVLIWILI